ncbi:MAG TPA: tripartite tricarboxylate transporter substrate binding protein [Burkholderiales bacterium]|nr:tripartite tricarboxylate transporter substrate binding protein [Burkholderiales bacterium]
MKQTCAAAIAAVSLLGVAHPGEAQQFPARHIRMLIGYTAGSEIDVVGRMLAQEMSEKWGYRVIVDNRSGAGGTLAGAIAAGSTADGYTWFFQSVSHTASRALYPKLTYDPVRDFAFVSQATSAPNVLIVAPSMGIKSTKALIAQARQKAGQMNYGHAGVGSGTHITGELFRLAADISVVHTPYKGTPELLADTVGGRIHYSFSPIGSTLGFIKDGRLVALGVTTLARSPSLPDVPTVAETGLPGFEWDQWYGMLVPAKTPAAVVEKIAGEMARVLALPQIKSGLAIRGSVPKPNTPQQFEKMVKAEVEKVTTALKAGGVKLD